MTLVFKAELIEVRLVPHPQHVVFRVSVLRSVHVGYPVQSVIITVNDRVGRVLFRRTHVAAEGVHFGDQIIIDK